MEHSGVNEESDWGALALEKRMHTPPPLPPPVQLHQPVNNQWFPNTLYTYSESRAWSSFSAQTMTSQSGQQWPITSWQVSSQPTMCSTTLSTTSMPSTVPTVQATGWQGASSLSRDDAEDWPITGDKIQRWQSPATLEDTPGFIDENMDDGMLADTEDSLTSAPTCQFTTPLSIAEYEQQGREYTQQALKDLLASPEYKKKHTQCQMCWNIWFDGQSRQDCVECGGFALERPCPICNGRCGAVWNRDVDMSHSQHEAHWDGKCALPLEQQQGFMLTQFREQGTEEELVQDFAELKSS